MNLSVSLSRRKLFKFPVSFWFQNRGIQLQGIRGFSSQYSLPFPLYLEHIETPTQQRNRRQLLHTSTSTSIETNDIKTKTYTDKIQSINDNQSNMKLRCFAKKESMRIRCFAKKSRCE